MGDGDGTLKPKNQATSSAQEYGSLVRLTQLLYDSVAIHAGDTQIEARTPRRR